MIGIYCILNLEDGKRYIGQTTNIKRRFNDHKSSLRRNDHENIHLQRAWNKFGEDKFEFIVLKICKIVALDKTESSYIRFYKTTDMRFGYNLENGGNKNKSLSEITRKKISKARKQNGNVMSKGALQRLSERMMGNTYRLGSKMSEDNKQKLIKVHTGNKYTLGRKCTDDERRRMSEFRKGNKFRLGIPHTEETKRKISESVKARRKTTILIGNPPKLAYY